MRAILKRWTVVLACLCCALPLTNVGAAKKEKTTTPTPPPSTPAVQTAAVEMQSELRIQALDQSTNTLLLALPKSSEAQVRELIIDVATHYRLTENYQFTDSATSKVSAPTGVTIVSAMARGEGAGQETVVMGYILPPRRLPQLWVAAWKGSETSRAPWSALVGGVQGDFAKTVQSLLVERNKIFSRLGLSDLESRVINLSYVDADAALFALRAMGYAAITDTESLATDNSYRGTELMGKEAATAQEPTQGQQSASGMGGGSFGGGSPSPYAALQGLPPDEIKRMLPKFLAIKNLPTSINFDRLPLIVRLPATEQRNMGLVGGTIESASNQGMMSGGAQRDALGLTAVPQTATSLTETIAGGSSQLLVMYHPAYPEQLQKLRRIIQDTIDRPARQVFVEGLVLEISSEALRDLGVKWDLKKGTQSFSVGTLSSLLPGENALSLLRDSALAVSPSQMMARINALVQTNKAEILSRPSVMTLDNRQATIRVGTDIPVATSKDSGGTGSTRVAFSFQYIPTGILMNVRPRVSEDGSEISMLIDATVSATVPNQDLKVIDQATRITLASAPTISTRRVQTYARIRDNTPLIIGGLVSRDQIAGTDKVPGIGEVPILGKLFGHENTQDRKREVIIVLTPSVVTENIRETKAQSPRDDDRFDQIDTALFKEHYRIRAEDLIDSSYIRFNRRFTTYRDLANQVIDRDPTLANRQPFSQFAGNRIPGEFVFVGGMMSKMLERIDAGRPIKLDNLMTFEKKGELGEQHPVSVLQLLARYGDGRNYKSFFDKNRNKALALTFQLSRASIRAEDMFAEPLPTISLIDCPDRDTWRQKLWEMNQPRGDLPQFTVLIHDESDLKRLQLAFAVQNTVLNNGGMAGMVFDRWLPGRMLHMQEVSPTWDRILLAPIAQYFFIGEHFTMYFMREHERAIQALDRALKQPESSLLVKGLEIPK